MAEYASPRLSPVFIVGSPRSGTSILISAILRAGYNGFLEGNFIALARVIERDVDRFFATFYTPNARVLTSTIDRDALKRQLCDLVLDAAVAQQPPAPWVDKTGGPEMIETIPRLRARFPQSRYVFAKRRAIENVTSRLIKFSGLSFDYHCADWARTMAAWRALKAAAPASDMIEVDQREISAQPAETARRIGAFLKLDDSATALLLRAFTSQTPQETARGTAHRVLTLDSTGWTPAQQAVFHATCDGEMAAQGYTTDQSYWTPDAPGRPGRADG